ncbi:winged helix-turn-helix domain-containing protein [Pedobacter sp. Leaf170]|uniref:winged helix-turn-helix domain-containing protein n=1 Tax=Pedobacter sp. Leaf170 TaxID=2876558 RepID=UPI001E6535DD|nr:winged helix-turn-helix domain-containing protein [Pedobacter sp. Leaf170]
MMFDSKNLLFGTGKYLLGFTAILFITAICLAFSVNYNDDFANSRREVLMRRIGHELLLQNGDKVSRVMPVNKIAENEYQIDFENKLTFQADSLVKTTQRILAKDPLVSEYVVNVLNPANASIAYSFAISNTKKDDIVACIGRKQPTANYTINIKFKPKGLQIEKNRYLLGSLPFLAFIGFIFFQSAKPKKTLTAAAQDANLISLGNVLFDAKNRKLTLNENTIDLTATETRVLLIFAMAPNEIIERSRLQKEIWEDEGVIVGRSLDMFISKLRKKLEIAPNINIVVIRSKGYKLEINA